jgi:hypothetical protein
MTHMPPNARIASDQKASNTKNDSCSRTSVDTPKWKLVKFESPERRAEGNTDRSTTKQLDSPIPSGSSDSLKDFLLLGSGAAVVAWLSLDTNCAAALGLNSIDPGHQWVDKQAYAQLISERCQAQVDQQVHDAGVMGLKIALITQLLLFVLLLARMCWKKRRRNVLRSAYT